MDVSMQQQGSGQPGLEDTPRVPLSLLTMIQTEQGQSGVKSGEYAKYRRHCTNKLRTLRRSLKLQHGRTKFIKRKIDASTVTDVRHLYLPLFSAERAWAYAMDIKKEMQGKVDLQKKRHMVTRLRKAARWAHELASLAAQRSDARGVLEAEAYAAWLAGSSLSEEEQQWGRALALLQRARRIYAALSEVGLEAEGRALCLQQVEGLDPLIRYCQYQLGRQGPAADAGVDQTAAEQAVGALSEGEVDSQLASLAAAAAAAAAQQQAASPSVVLQWQGQQLVVRQERLKAAVSRVQQLAAEAAGVQATDVDGAEAVSSSGVPAAAAAGLEGRLAAYERLSKALSQARQEASTLLKSASSGGEGDAQLQLVGAALEGMAAQAAVDRAQLAADSLQARFASSLAKAAAVVAAGKKPSQVGEGRTGVRAEDVVRALDLLARALTEQADVGARAGGRAGEALYDQATAQGACVRAARVYHTAHSALAGGRVLEALALFGRCQERCAAALDQGPSPQLAQQVQRLATQAQAYRLVAQAECAVSRAREREGVEQGLGGLGLVDAPAATSSSSQQPGANKYLLDEPGMCVSYAGTVGGKGTPAVYRLPFSMQAVPCRPIMLDTAAEHIAYPSVEHRLRKEEKRSVLSSLGLGWAWGSGKK